MLKACDIELVEQGLCIQGRRGSSLLEALAQASIFLRSDCGGKGKCGKCRVNKITAAGKRKSIISCNYQVREKIRIEIPKSSMLSSHIISKPQLSFPPSFFKKITAGASSASSYGVAVDLGTTTIAIYLCNRKKGEVIFSTALKSPQALYGDDVMSRIGAILADKSNLKNLQKLVVRSLEWGISEVIGNQDLGKNEISQIVAVGNPAMIHILLGINPAPIGSSPYQPVFYEAKTTETNQINLKFVDCNILTLPQISGFIGGDIIAGALATDMENQPEGTLLIDLGTNGELLLKARDQFFATSCATGPAFEGASLACGMQAIAGAINRVIIKNVRNYPEYTMVSTGERGRPAGICGTGAISAVAELWRNRLIQSSGAFVTDETITPLQRDKRGKTRYIIAERQPGVEGEAIFLSQKDIRAVQLGKAALSTGIDFLIKAAGYDEPQKIIIAGAFGAYIDIEDMIAIGMIPDLGKKRIESAGNAAGAGAIMVLSDEYYLKRSVGIADRTTTIDLAAKQSFQKVFVDRLVFQEN